MTLPDLSLEGVSNSIRDLITERAESVAGFSIPMIAAQVPNILEGFARMIATDSARRDMLKPATPFTGTIVGGSYDLATNIADDRYLLDFFTSTEFRLNPDTLGVPFHCVSQRGTLRLKKPTDVMFVNCALEGSVLYTRSTTGALDANLGAITISGPFIPIIGEDAADTTLPFSLRGEFQNYAAMVLISGQSTPQRARHGR